MNQGLRDSFEGNMHIEPPTLLRVFSPSGEQFEFFGWVGFRIHPRKKRMFQLISHEEHGVIRGLSPLVAVVNVKTGMVVYDPRETPNSGIIGPVLSQGHYEWLDEHTHWPNMLELYDNPAQEDINEGLED